VAEDISLLHLMNATEYWYTKGGALCGGCLMRVDKRAARISQRAAPTSSTKLVGLQADEEVCVSITNPYSHNQDPDIAASLRFAAAR